MSAVNNSTNSGTSLWDREWTDAELYKMYDITAEEQAFIAELIREMSA